MSSEFKTPKYSIPKRFEGKTSSVWNEYADIFEKYQPLSLGPGFADYQVTKDFDNILADVVANADNSMSQYARAAGHPRLVNALAALYSKFTDRQIDAESEVIVTLGAMEAIFATILTNVDDGDEVIIIEPFFDCYDPVIQMAGGITRSVPLKLKGEWKNDEVSSADYVLDDDELRSVFNEKTKMIVLNTPNNPLGKIFSRDELQKIANLCHEFDVLCLSDEVYEWVVYDDNEHVRMCTLPGMWERTITIGSAGKTFSLTGWRIGWAYGPAELITNMNLIHAQVAYTCATQLQEALGIIMEREIARLGTPESFFAILAKQLVEKRDYMLKELKAIGMKVVVPQGGYFIIADWSGLESKTDLSAEKDEWADFRFTKWLAKSVGVMGIPPSVFYSDNNKPANEKNIRICFFKGDEKLQKGVELLKNWASK